MDTNLVLFWFVVLSCVVQLKLAIQVARAGLPGGLVVMVLVLGVSGSVALIDFDAAGFWALGLFTLLVLVPGLLQRRVRSLSQAQRYTEALPYTRVLALLHPSRNQRRQPALYQALAQARRGDLAAAEASLAALAAANPRDAAEAQLHLHRLRGEWAAYLQITDRYPEAVLRRDLSLMFGRLRALGECGELERMVTTYAQYARLLDSANLAQLRAQALLIVMAFCGRSAALELLLTHFLGAMTERGRRGWRAICACAAGDPRAQALLEALAADDDAETARSGQQRLREPPRQASGALSRESEAKLTALEQGIAHELHYQRAQPLKSARLVQLLVALNVAAFVAEELLGGSEDGPTLVRLGALVSGVLTPGESYRLVTKLFLHYGVLHLAMNMLGLIAIGPFVESALGKLRTLFLYLAAGVAGSLLEVLLPGDDPQLFVGASGCIMGLLGATAAVLLFDYRRQGAQPAKSRLGRIGFVLVAQLGFDLTVPNISLYAHWSGVLVGFLLGLGLTRGTGQKQSGNGSRSPGPQTR